MMMFVVVVLCGGLGWIAYRVRVQRDAVAAIRRAGGHVVYDWQKSNGIPIWNRKPRAPGWLVDLLGVDYFNNVTGVYLDEPVTDEEIDHIGRLWSLEELSLATSTTDDESLSRLAGLTRLRSLNLNASGVTDAGLRHLRGFANLQRLSLTNTKISDDGLAHLKGLTNLQSLSIRSTRVARAASMAELRDLMPNLKIDH